MQNTKIEWTDRTWNPVTGCKRGCFYCYVKRLRNYSMDPAIHPERLERPLKVKKPQMIFTCSTADLFGNWVPTTWILQVLDIIRQCPQHIFQLLTKNPGRMRDFQFPPNCWLGITETGTKVNWTAPGFKPQSDYLIDDWGWFDTPNLKFISFEPLLKPIYQQIPPGVGWIIIGAMTGKGGRVVKEYRPLVAWIEDLLNKADYRRIPVFMKDNLAGIWPEELRQEWPEGGGRSICDVGNA